MTLAHMLAGYTVSGVRQLRMENEIGLIAPGKQADLVVVERDLFLDPPNRIHAVPVVLTMSTDRIVFERKKPSRPSSLFSALPAIRQKTTSKLFPFFELDH